MPVIERKAKAPYSALQMFDLVNDVASYPAFIPYCTKSQVLLVTEQEMQASLTFAKGSMSKSFSTINQLQKGRSIVLQLRDGPFKKLIGHWSFIETATGCDIALRLEFEFSSRMVAILFGPLFQQVANQLVSAFTKRADFIYGVQAI